MNVGPANAIQPVNSTIEVREQGGRNASSFEREELATQESGSSDGEAASETKVDARETLRLLNEGRIRGIGGGRFRLHLHEGAVSSKVAAVHAEVERMTKEALAPLREILNVGLFDDETRTLLEEAFGQVKSGVDELQAEVGEATLDAEQLYIDLQEAFEQYHEMLKKIFRLVKADTSEEGQEAAAAAGEPGEPSEAARAEEAWDGDPADEGEKTTAERQEEMMQRMLESIEQALEDVQERIDAEDGSPGGAGSEEESTYAEFVAAYESLSDAPAETSAFSTEG